MSGKTEDGFQFETVLREELHLIDHLRHASETPLAGESDPETSAFQDAHTSNLTGLAFSGGGIRSATFNLGLIQALAKVRHKEKNKTGLLSRFDYLSTVSGGGYIGSWLSAWLHREATTKNERKNLREHVKVDAKFVDEIQSKITTRPCSFGPQPSDPKECIEQSGFDMPWTTGFPPLEHAAVRYLRRYSNYLTPRLGLSGDTLAVISLFLRNFVLLQLALISLVVAILLVPYGVASVSVSVFNTEAGSLLKPMVALVAGFLLLIATLLIWRPQILQLFRAPDQPEDRSKKLAVGWWVGLSVLFSTLACWLFLIGSVPYFSMKELVPRPFVLFGMLGYTASWLIGPGSISFFISDKIDLPRVALVKHFLIALLSGAVFGLSIYFFADWLNAADFDKSGRILPAISFIPPLILLILSFNIALHLGLARSLFNEQEREWWARLGGYVLLAAFAWAIIFSIAFFAPSLYYWLNYGGMAIVIAWACTSGVGAWIARGAGGGDDESGSVGKNLLMKIAPWLFIGGLGLLISVGLFIVVKSLGGDLNDGESLLEQGMSMSGVLSVTSPVIEEVPFLDAFLTLLVATGIFLFICWRLDINAFSAHSLYRNRLVRAFLGASRAGKRKPHAFSGFDPKDDLRLASLCEQRPIPILNTTINMTGGDDLAWQTRRAASFTFTPQFVGYETKSSQGFNLGGYRRTWEYAIGKTITRPGKPENDAKSSRERQPWHPDIKDIGGIRLGTALAISGAAASPNMGFNTSPSIAALLTAFNLRLGYWAGNTALGLDSNNKKITSSSADAVWRKKRALLCAQPIVAELTGSANAESDWINLSDGGHFDNLGIYELVRRRCRFIVVSDAGCDPKHQFQDLANTIRKCWTDLGVHIFFSKLDELCHAGDQKRCCLKHGSLGLIEYPDRKRQRPDGKELERERFGLILYLKCSLTKAELSKYVDIRQYAETHPDFPHQSTADQFFDENQFEAYRHLGFCVGETYRSLIEEMFDSKTGLIDEAMVFEKAKEIYTEQEQDIQP
ncbi:MAG: patatin-like phospholipase family protein [Xanthomonadales bacterium]|nr:patatin-like phospholipase family protein [Xanthomonadales bacterium]